MGIIVEVEIRFIFEFWLPEYYVFYSTTSAFMIFRKSEFSFVLSTRKLDYLHFLILWKTEMVGKVCLTLFLEVISYGIFLEFEKSSQKSWALQPQLRYIASWKYTGRTLTLQLFVFLPRINNFSWWLVGWFDLSCQHFLTLADAVLSNTQPWALKDSNNKRYAVRR